jgi:hypothetical protein
MMHQVLLLIATLATVSAFMPSGVARNGCSAWSMKLNMPGSSAPLGFFDPLGFSTKADAATIAKYRESELKHGRVAMLAVAGVLIQERFHPFFNGKLSSDPLTAFGGLPPIGAVQIIAFIGLLEYTFTSSALNKGYTPGDYYGISARIPDDQDKAWVGFQTRELNNGRLAMFGILGQLAHSGLTGKGPFELMGMPTF